MTQPPIDPSGREPVADASPTEPVPVVTAPAGASAFDAPSHGGSTASAGAGASTAPGFATPPAFAFTPVEPEPGPILPAAPVASAGPAARNGGSSRILTIALGAAVLVGAVGIAFAAGRATAPGADASNTAAIPADGATGAQGGGLGPVDPGPNDPGTGNGNGGIGGGNLPDASFDLDGDGNGRPGAPGDGFDDDDGDRGFGRGLRGIELSGTVTAVTSDRITIQSDAGPVITFSLDGTTTYHQDGEASASDVRTGSRVQVTPRGRVQPTRGADGGIDLGTAGDITITP